MTSVDKPLDDYTAEPHERDSLFPVPPIYAEEAGVQADRATRTGVHPCPTCGTPILEGRTDKDLTLSVEPGVRTYTVLWLAKARWPRLTECRSYPVHRCR